MVCPMCVTAAIIANAPGIAAAVSGVAAAKLAFDQRGGGSGRRGKDAARPPVAADRPTAVARMVVDRRELPPISSYVDDEF